MPLSQYVLGLGFLLGTVVGVGTATRLLVAKRLSHLARIDRTLAHALVFTLGVLAIHVVALAAGVLTRGTVLGASLALMVLAWLAPRQPGRPPVSHRPPAQSAQASGIGSRMLAITAFSLVAVYELARLRGLTFLPLTDTDVLNFHLPGVARWIQSGSLWQTDQLFPFFVTGYYPNNGDVMTLAAVLPWRMAAFARYVDAAFFALTALATYALACELGARRCTAVTCTSALAVVPALSNYALEGLPDVVMLFGLCTGALFLVRHCRNGRSCELVLAGLALGLAFGAKWYGVTSVAMAGITWLALSLIARRGVWRTLRQGLALVGLIALAGAIWLVRNITQSGNPLYPQKISLLGVQLFPAPHGGILDRVGFTVLGYVGKPSVLTHYVIPGLSGQLGLAGWLFVGGALAAFGLAIWSSRAPAPRAPAHALWGAPLAAVLISVLYAATPGSAFGRRDMPVLAFATVRWLIPAPMLAAAATAAVAARLGRLRLVVELVALAAVIDGIRRGPSVSATSLATAALAVGLGASWLVVRGRRSGPRPLLSRWRTSAVALAGLLVVAALGRAVEERVLDHRYGTTEPVVAWVQQHAPGGHRIGLSGVWSGDGLSPAFPAFGPRLANKVVYVGPVAAGLLRQYTREQSFEAALARGRYDLLLVGRGEPPLGSDPSEAWARAAGFTLVISSRRLALYRAPASQPPRGPKS